MLVANFKVSNQSSSSVKVYVNQCQDARGQPRYQLPAKLLSEFRPDPRRNFSPASAKGPSYGHPQRSRLCSISAAGS